MVYRLRYTDVQAEAPLNAKANEREILKRSIDLLKDAAEPNSDPLVAVEAIHFSTRVWTALLSDLANSDNLLPDEVRSGLISIGIWILKELEEIRQGRSNSYGEIIVITETIRDGLR